MEFLRQKRLWRWLLTALPLVLFYVFSLPRPLFKAPLSMVLEDRNGELLSARIAADGQWRFPMPDSLPENYIKALIAFEDQRFYYHPGVDPIALGRAILQNFRNGRIVSGGSTISMQVIRLARQGKSRTVVQKMLEAIMATRLELGYSKRSILRLYAANAPFGGNVVGLEAASWRYFGKSPHLLSWGEVALLAILPNSPAMIHPGRNRDALLAKRNRLLDRMARGGLLDALTLELAKSEPLPGAPLPLPRLAPHLLDRAAREHAGNPMLARVRTTIDASLQQQVLEICARHHGILRFNEVHNLAAVIVRVSDGAVMAYAGNAPNAGALHGEAVDVITAPRSSGSILKPLLYALSLQEGLILPHSWLPDVPTSINGYSPENFHLGYDGLAPVSEALSRSLNIPFVGLLKTYDIGRFHFQLRKLGFRTITRQPDHYGLTLILGGAETSLWDLGSVYASMARTLNRFSAESSTYNEQDFHPLYYELMGNDRAKARNRGAVRQAPFMTAGAIWATFNAMQELQRPESEGDWAQFSSSRKIAWKTGTSFGFRDAWSVGLTPEYLVSVWVGNADGEGRPDLVGARVAAPLMFDLFALLPPTTWFDPPYDDLIRLAVCQETGFRAGQYCTADTIRTPKASLNAPLCPYHQLVHLDEKQQYQVNADCEPTNQIAHVPWMVIPPLEEYYYRQKHPEYKPLPPLRPDCGTKGSETMASNPMQLIYPRQNTRIYVPVDLDGQLSRTVFQLAHREPETTVFWHLDREFVGSTRTFHSFAFNPSPGKHLLTVVDENGRRLEQWFEIVEKRQ